MGDHLALDFPADEIPAAAFLAHAVRASTVAARYSSAANASRLNRYAVLEVLGDMESLKLFPRGASAFTKAPLTGMTSPNSDASFSRDSDKDVTTQGVYLKFGPRRNPTPAPLLADAVEAPVLGDENDGYTVVRSRKHGMVRGNFPEGPYMAPEDQILENVALWLRKAGPLRKTTLSKTRQWAQARKGRYIVTPEGPSYLVYGTYGPNNSVEY